APSPVRPAAASRITGRARTVRRAILHSRIALTAASTSAWPAHLPIRIWQAPAARRLLSLLIEGAPFVGDHANDENLLQKVRPLIMRLHSKTLNERKRLLTSAQSSTDSSSSETSPCLDALLPCSLLLTFQDISCKLSILQGSGCASPNTIGSSVTTNS